VIHEIEYYAALKWREIWTHATTKKITNNTEEISQSHRDQYCAVLLMRNPKKPNL
jgi:hypothetical protein